MVVITVRVRVRETFMVNTTKNPNLQAISKTRQIRQLKSACGFFGLLPLPAS